MSLGHAILVSLLERPSTGFELARHFDRSIGQFWNARHQQIYRELSRLEAAGWIAGAEASPRRRREYLVLPAGRSELVRWMTEPTPPPTLKSALGLKLRALTFVDGVDLRPDFERNLREIEIETARLAALDRRDFPDGKALTRRERIYRSILRQGLAFDRLRIAWYREVIDLLGDLASSPPPTDGQHDAIPAPATAHSDGTPP